MCAGFYRLAAATARAARPRIYSGCTLTLNLRIKPKRRIEREKPQPLAVPDAPNTIWSMDFMHDQLTDGRTFCLFNVLDDFNREGPEFISHDPKQWAGRRDIRLEFIQPGNPQQNAYVERYNRTVRYRKFRHAWYSDNLRRHRLTLPSWRFLRSSRANSVT